MLEATLALSDKAFAGSDPCFTATLAHNSGKNDKDTACDEEDSNVLTGLVAEKEPDYQHLYPSHHVPVRRLGCQMGWQRDAILRSRKRGVVCPQCAVKCIKFVQGWVGTFQRRLLLLPQISDEARRSANGHVRTVSAICRRMRANGESHARSRE